MSATLIQSVAGGNGGASTVHSLPSPVTKGSLIVVGMGNGSSGLAGLSVSDNLNGPYTPVPDSYNADFSVQLFYCANAKPGTTTVTAVSPGGSVIAVSINEFGNVAHDAVVRASGNTSNNSIPPSIDLAGVGVGDVVVGYIAGSGNTPGSGFVFGGNDGSGDFLEYLIASAEGTVTVDIGSGSGGLAAAAFSVKHAPVSEVSLTAAQVAAAGAVTAESVASPVVGDGSPSGETPNLGLPGWTTNPNTFTVPTLNQTQINADGYVK